jgi:glycosyltransferase involved in cell wall biosynthesis
MTRPKINFFMVDLFKTGGVRFYLELANRLAGLGQYDIIVTYYYKEKSPFHIVKEGVKLVPLAIFEPKPSYSASVLSRGLAFYRERLRGREPEPLYFYLDRLLRRRFGIGLDLSPIFVDNIPESDIIIASWNTDALCAYISGKGIPVYLAQTAPQLYKETSQYRNQNASIELEKLMYKAYQYFLSASEYNRELISSVNKQAKSFIVNPAVDTNVFRPNEAKRLEPEVPTVSVIVSPFRFKGTDDALKVLNRVNERRRIVVLFVGSRQSLGIIKKSSPELDFSYELIEGASDEKMAEVYSESDVFLYTSYEEGFGLPPLEAMGCRTPVVMTDCKGSREYAQNNYNALIANPGDVDTLTRHVLRLLEDKNLRQEITEGGYATVRKFCWTRTLEQARAAIEGILEDRNR